jgi:hypothetical protein
MIVVFNLDENFFITKLIIITIDEQSEKVYNKHRNIVYDKHTNDIMQKEEKIIPNKRKTKPSFSESVATSCKKVFF